MGWFLNWAQDIDLEKNIMYALHLEFFFSSWLWRRKGEMDYIAQYNFTVGIRGFAIEEASEPGRLGVDRKKNPALPSDDRPSAKHESCQTADGKYYFLSPSSWVSTEFLLMAVSSSRQMP